MPCRRSDLAFTWATHSCSESSHLNNVRKNINANCSCSNQSCHVHACTYKVTSVANICTSRSSTLFIYTVMVKSITVVYA